MRTIDFLLYALACACFLVAALEVVSSRVNLIALGLLAAVLPTLIHAGQALN